MPKFAAKIENDDVRRVWNYVLPQQPKSTGSSSIKSIPVLTKQKCIEEEKQKIQTF